MELSALPEPPWASRVYFVILVFSWMCVFGRTRRQQLVSRQGLGKLRHIDTHTLWIQERVRNKSLKLRKVKGECNPADLLTKHMPSREKLTQLVQLFGCAFVEGRAASAPLLRKRKPEELAGHGFADDVIEVIEDSDLHGKIFMLEAKAHDVGRWPHLYPADEQEVMFPLVIAAPDVETPTAEELGEHKALHERWATRRPGQEKVQHRK